MEYPQGNQEQFDAAMCVAGILAGDRACEDALVSFFARRIYMYALRALREPAIAEDVTQETLWATVKSLREGSLTEPAQLFVFVYGIARHRVADVQRRASRNRQDAFPPGFDPAAPPDRNPADRERRELAAEAIRQLDPVDRTILQLLLNEGLSSPEIASRLELKPDAVRQRKSRALKRVMEKLRNVTAARPRLTESGKGE